MSFSSAQFSSVAQSCPTLRDHMNCNTPGLPVHHQLPAFTKGRRTANEEYRCQNRGGFGSTNYKTNEEKGLVAGVKAVADTDDVILISDDGIIIRTQVDSINLQSRYGSGVNVMRINEGAKLVTFARTPAEEEIQEDENEDN